MLRAPLKKSAEHHLNSEVQVHLSVSLIVLGAQSGYILEYVVVFSLLDIWSHKKGIKVMTDSCLWLNGRVYVQ